MTVQSQLSEVSGYFETHHHDWHAVYREDVADGLLFRTRLHLAMELCRRHVRRTGRALDLACGCGSATIALARMGHDATGIDLVNSMIERGREEADRSKARRVLGRPHDETILITVGHLCRRKGMHRVLRVLPELLERYSALHYVIVGADGAEGRFGAKLERQIRRLGLRQKVTITGPLQSPDVAGWLQAADLFVLPTGNEGYCNALCEALATGLPVVCTDVGGNQEIVTPANGRLVPFGDDRALLDAIDVTLNGNLDRSAIAHAARRRDWSHVAHETAAVLQNAVHQSAHAHGLQSDISL